MSTPLIEPGYPSRRHHTSLIQRMASRCSAVSESRRSSSGSRMCGAGGRSEERRVGKECRSRCDWSSDVCSSDLPPAPHILDPEDGLPLFGGQRIAEVILWIKDVWCRREIGRASCRERV